jgi:hypothetical protein
MTRMLNMIDFYVNSYKIARFYVSLQIIITGKYKDK